MAALARHAVGRFTPGRRRPRTPARCAPTCVALAERWTAPLDREERAVASIVGAARHEEELRAGLDDGAGAAARRGGRRDRRARRGRAASRSTPSRLALLGSVLEAFWWQRYTAAGDGAMTADQVERVVDDVLLPIAAPASADAAASRPRV